MNHKVYYPWFALGTISWKLNLGVLTIFWLFPFCRELCNFRMTQMSPFMQTMAKVLYFNNLLGDWRLLVFDDTKEDDSDFPNGNIRSLCNASIWMPICMWIITSIFYLLNVSLIGATYVFEKLQEFFLVKSGIQLNENILAL
mgnify:CR=1 FL=1